jgi:hypothetical protein
MKHYLIIILFFCASSSFADLSQSDTNQACGEIQLKCDALKNKYAAAIKSWSEIQFNSTPDDIKLAENSWHSCLKNKKEKQCY